MDPVRKTVSDTGMSLSDDSPCNVMQDLCKGIIKDPFTFDDKVHEECPTQPGVPDEKRMTIVRFWRDSYLKSLNKAVSRVQDWFTKITFKNKVKFTGSAIGLMTDSRKLFDLAYFIGPPTKDYVYAHTQFTRSSDDVAAVDHNRANDDSSYDSQSSAYLDWFQSLNPREQFDAVVGLIHLGGAAMEENIYGKVVKILEEKERNVIRQKVLQYLAHKRESSTKFVASKVAKHKQKLHQAPVKQKAQIQPQRSESDEGEDVVDRMALLKRKIAEYDNSIKNMENVASHIDATPRKEKDRSKSRSMSKGRKSNRRSSQSGIKRLDKWSNGIDRVQMLPLWDNRMIMSMLPHKSIESMTRVNKYWKDMVDKTKKEMKVRKRLDKVLNKRVAEGKHSRHKGNKKDGKQTKKINHSGDDKRRPKEQNIMPEDFHPHLDPYEVFSEDPPKVKPFSNTHETYVICEEFCDDRAMDANKRWAAYSKKADIELCNVVFGVPCNLKLEYPRSFKISCICFHPNEAALVFTGRYDGKVELHDIWKRNVKMVYAGHRGIVSDVAANCRYVASCGMDHTIRVFNISDGRSMMCLAEDNVSPCKLLMTDCAYPLLYVATSNGEVVMYNVRDSESSKRIVGCGWTAPQLLQIASACNLCVPRMRDPHPDCIKKLDAHRLQSSKNGVDARRCYLTGRAAEKPNYLDHIYHADLLNQPLNGCSSVRMDPTTSKRRRELKYVLNEHKNSIQAQLFTGKTVTAHNGEVTSLNHYPCVLLTTGVDGFVRMWATNYENPRWILSLKHPIRVNAAVMSYKKIVSAGEDGKLRIWDVMTGVCDKVLTITPTGRPVLSVRCIRGPQSVKFVLNNEADIRVVEFPLRKPIPGKKLGRYKGSKLKPVSDFRKRQSPVRPIMSSYDKRMAKLQMRQAVSTTIRPSQTKSPPLLQDRQKWNINFDE